MEGFFVCVVVFYLTLAEVTIMIVVVRSQSSALRLI